MATKEECRRYAEDCLRLAKNSSSETKACLIVMASAWHRMAQEQENTEPRVGEVDAARAERRDEH